MKKISNLGCENVYSRSLRKWNSCEKALLFGSWAKGTARDNSDVDVALVSSFFIGARFLGRRKIVPLRRKINKNIEPMPFSPEDFAAGGAFVDETRRVW